VITAARWFRLISLRYTIGRSSGGFAAGCALAENGELVVEVLG